MGLASLKLLQWAVRGIQFCCAGLVFSIYSYYLATLQNHGLSIATWIRAVEGISGFALLYIISQLVLLCFIAGYPLTSFLAMVFDFAFLVAFIYVAQANRGGAGSCTGHVDTPFGSGDANKVVVDDGHGGFTSLPSLHQACQLESACLAVSILIIFFFIFSMLLEWRLGRQRNKDRRGGFVPTDEETVGLGASGGSKRRGAGFLGFLRTLSRRGTRKDYDNILPEHTHPDQLAVNHEPKPTASGAITAASTAAPAAQVAPATPTSPGYNRYAGYGDYHRDSSPYANVDTRYHNGAPHAVTPSPTIHDFTPSPTHGTYQQPAAHSPERVTTQDFAPSATHRTYQQPTVHSPERVTFPAGNYHYSDSIYSRGT